MSLLYTEDITTGLNIHQPTDGSSYPDAYPKESKTFF